jgi:hypothetical protein
MQSCCASVQFFVAGVHWPLEQNALLHADVEVQDIAGSIAQNPSSVHTSVVQLSATRSQAETFAHGLVCHVFNTVSR